MSTVMTGLRCAPSPVHRALSTARRLAPTLLLAGIVMFLLAFVVLPLGVLWMKSFADRDGAWIGVANYVRFAHSPALGRAAVHSLLVAGLATALTLAVAFPFAFGLTRTRMRAKGLLRTLVQIPMLAPSLLPALSIVYLFGNRGLLRDWMMGQSIYGPLGIVAAEVFFCLPQALMILVTALSVADARLYEAATTLGAGPGRRFLTITVPAAQYGLVNAAFVVFIMVLTDFGIPKVLGGDYAVLATEIYEQVVGLQDFGTGAVVGMVLLLPVLLAIACESWSAGRQKALLSARSVPYRAPPNRTADTGFLLFCGFVAMLLVGIMMTAGFGSLVTFWPYNLHLTMRNYDFTRTDSAGWSSYVNSLRLAAFTALFGSGLVFGGAYLMEKTPAAAGVKRLARLLAMIPLGIPGTVLGLSYVLFFNHPDNPLQGLYGTFVLLAISCVVHFYSVGHVTAVTALKQLDGEFEQVSASLKVPLWLTFWRVTVPLCLPALLDIAFYLFVNTMTTVSALVFLYTPDTKPAAVAILNMDDSGSVAGAAAMAMMIALSSGAARLLHVGLEGLLLRRARRWRASR